MGAVPIDGKAFWESLPEEIRPQFPQLVKRFVIDVPHDGPVRVLCEAYGTEEFTRPLVEAVLRADVEIVEASPSPASLVETIAAMPVEKRKDFLGDLRDEICIECGGDDGWQCTCMRDD